MELRELGRTKRRENQRILLIAELGRRQDQLLRAKKPDLGALERLADDYDAAGLYNIGAQLASRLEWSRVDSFWSGPQPGAARPAVPDVKALRAADDVPAPGGIRSGYHEFAGPIKQGAIYLQLSTRAVFRNAKGQT